MPETRTYSWGNYSEWKIKALKERRDIDQDILDYDDEIDDDFRKYLNGEIGDLDEWLKELREHKKDVNKDMSIMKWKIKIMDEIKENIELNLKENTGYLNEEEKEIYEQEIRYAKRYLNELKKK